MMNRLHHRKNWSHSEAQISAALSADSCHLVLETEPPDYVEKISRYLESSVGHSKRAPESTDSDSGNSLFITQNTVPEAVRSQRRCHSTQRSEEPTSHTELEDSEDSGKERRRKEQKLPIYSFPFLKEKERERKRKDRSAELSVKDNIKIHYAGMGGFFHSVKELWQSYEEGDNLKSSLPTVDMDGEEITPLSEEGERSDDEDIKVVERNRFVVSCKAKRRQTWKAPQKRDNQMEQQRKRRRVSNATQETSPRKQRTGLYKTTMPKSKEMVSSSDSDSADDGESSRRVQAERRRSNKHLKSRRKIAYQTPPPPPPSSTNSQKVKKGKLRDDSDATNPAERTQQQDREVSSTTVTADVCHILNLTETEQPEDEPGTGESQDLPQRPPHLIKDSNGDESSIKKRKKKKEKHGDEDKETEAQQAVTSEDVVMADAESPAPQDADEPELNENNQTENSLRDDGDTLREEGGEIERELPFLKQKKKKRKKNKAAVENNEQQDEVGHLECDVSVEEKKKKKKKKKRERKGDREEDVEQLSSGAVAEPLNDAETSKQKKKRKKERSLVNTEVSNSTLDQLEEHESCLERNAASQETLDSSYVKKKRSCLDATEAGGEDDDAGDVSMSNDAATPAGKKKKKKKKKRKGSSECEEDADAEIPKKMVNREEVLNSTVDQMEEPESCLESNAASQETLESSFVKKKKHKKKKQSCLDEAGGEEVVGDVSMSNDAATPAGKKKKKKKKKISICDGTDVSLEETTGDKDAELVSKKKKKKKKKEILSRNMSDTEAQSHDSVSVREKEKKKKKKASSFLAADAEGNCAQTQQDKSFPSQSVAVSAGDSEAESAETAGNVSVTESNGEVRKKKKKKEKKTSDKDSERDFEEQNETRQSDLPETTDVVVKRKKKRRREESESVTPAESAADVGCLEIDEAVVVKKKKKKRKRDSSSVIEDAESEVSTQTSHKKKQKSSHLDPKSKHSAESSHDNNRKSEQDTKDTHLDVPGNDLTPKKKKKKKCSSNVLPEGKSEVKAVEVEPQKERNKTSASPRVISSSSDSPSCFKMSSSDSIKIKEHIKAKKTLYNPSESFLT